MCSYAIVYDLGTTGLKAVLFDLDNHLIKSSILVEYPTFNPSPLWAEQDPEDWWKAFKLATRKLLINSSIPPEKIEVIGFSGQMMACLPVSKDGKHLRRAIIWMDQRSISEVEMIKKIIGEYDFYKITGNRLSPTYPIAKILWLKRNEPQIYEETHVFLQPKDYMVAKLTGEFYTDITDAALTGAMDILRRQWAWDMLEELELDPDKFPSIVPSSRIIGEISETVAKETGLSNETKVVIGCGDGGCAAAGAGAIQNGDIYIYMGASAWISIISDKPLFEKSARLFNQGHVDEKLYAPTGTMQAAGVSLRWFRDNIFAASRELLTEIDVYRQIEQEAVKSPPGAKGLIYLPYLMGERAPWWTPHARGALIGLTLSHNLSDITRSIFEGVAMNLGIIYRIFVENGVTGKGIIRLIGGGAKSTLWPRVLSAILQRDVGVLKYPMEATALGALIAAGIGIGLFKSPEIINDVNPIVQVYRAEQNEIEIYSQYIKLFEEAYISLEKFFEKIAKISSETASRQVEVK